MKIIRNLCFFMLFVFACDEVSDALGSGEAGVSIKIPRSIPNKRAKKTSHIKISEVKILIDRIKFHKTEDDSTNFADGPFIAVLDSTLNFKEIAVNSIPDGTYEQISFKIHKPGPNEVIADSVFTTGGRYSLIVTGVIGDSANFVYKMDKTITQKLFIDPPFVINGEGTYNSTILMDTETWFVDKGNDLNPLDPKDNNKIENSIKASFRAFKDNNKDGLDD